MKPNNLILSLAVLLCLHLSFSGTHCARALRVPLVFVSLSHRLYTPRLLAFAAFTLLAFQVFSVTVPYVGHRAVFALWQDH